MKLKSIKFKTVKDDDGDTVSLPDRITVEMTIAQAAAIATFFGNLNDYGLRRVYQTGVEWEEMHGPYNCLIGSVFNRYWEDGINEYRGFQRMPNEWFAALNEVLK